MRLGAMGFIVPLHQSAAACRGDRHRRPDARRPLESASSPASRPVSSTPFGVDFTTAAKSPTLEFVQIPARSLCGTQPSPSTATSITPTRRATRVQPVQKPHPPLWIESRDPRRSILRARGRLNIGYFLIVPRTTQPRATTSSRPTGPRPATPASPTSPIRLSSMSTRPMRRRCRPRSPRPARLIAASCRRPTIPPN